MLKLTPAMAHLRWHTSNRLMVLASKKMPRSALDPEALHQCSNPGQAQDHIQALGTPASS